MRPIQSNRRTSSSFLLGAGLILLLGGGAVVGLLWLLGFFSGPPQDDPFMVRIPINGHPIPAYERVTRDHLLNPKKPGQLTFQRIPPSAAVGMSITGVSSDGSHVESRVESVRNVNDSVVFVTADGHEVAHEQTLELGGALMNIGAIVGRVVQKDKRAGFGFQESTFFPRGTPEGLAGATPPGMRAITLNASQLSGVHGLNAGDHIDLMASVPVGEAGAFGAPGSRQSSQLPSPDGDEKLVTEPIMLAQNAVVLKPVYVRNEATTSSSLTQGKRVQNVPKYEVAIALSSEDLIPVQTALDKSLSITCIARSMRPNDDGEEGGEEDNLPDGDQRRVPVTVRPILAYDVVTRDAFVSPATRQLRVELLSQQEIDRKGIITSLDDVFGAVARHDIPAGRFLRETDLLRGAVEPRPLGMTRPGRQQQPYFVASNSEATSPSNASPPTVVGDRPSITQFVPAGYTALAIPWNRLYGAEHLQIGDKMDLLASYPLESNTEDVEIETRPDGTTISRKRQGTSTRETMRSWDESLGLRAEPWFVASDAIVVGPVGFPAPAAAIRALGNGDRSNADGQGLSGPPLLIAIDDRDVETLAAALSTKDVLFTAAFHPPQVPAASGSGTKRIAIAAQDIAAYEQLTETVWNGNRRRPIFRIVAEDDTRFIEALTVEDLATYEFRVLRHAKRKGSFFASDDFLPEGTSPGLAAAAKSGETIFAVADREIEGLDVFESGDFVTILVRGIVEAPTGVIAHGAELKRPVSRVVVPAARIVRDSRGGQTILAVADADLTRLQAAWASSMTDNDGKSDNDERSHLLAVALPRAGNMPTPPVAEVATLSSLAKGQAGRSHQNAIPDFDPAGEVKMLEAIVGTRREWHAFSNAPQSAKDGDNGVAKQVNPSSAEHLARE